MRLTQGSLPPREERGLFVGNFSFKSRSSPSNALLPSSPLRTVRESFPSHSSSPSNASFRETRFRDRNSLAMNPGHGTLDEVERGSRRFANHPSHGERSGAG